jgi:hypothetical protein
VAGGERQQAANSSHISRGVCAAGGGGGQRARSDRSFPGSVG